MASRRGSALAALWGALISASLATPLALAAQTPTDTLEQVLVELQMGRLTSRTVSAYRLGSEALLPLTQFLEMAEIQYRLSLEGRLEGMMEPGHRVLIVDAVQDTARLGTHRVAIEPSFRLYRDGELFVGAERLGDLIGTRVIVDWAELTASVVDPTELPIGRRLRREVAREAFLRAGDRLVRADRAFGLERPKWGGVVFDYSFLAPSSDPIAGGGYTAGLGADVVGGSLELSVASTGRLDEGQARGEASWTGIWREGRWLKQLRLGDGQATGPRPRTMRGVSVSNSPFIRTSALGDVRYAGRLQGGWAVEAYRGGSLVAFDSTDEVGRFTVTLPVSFGENPVDFVGYGPFGEIVEFNRTYRVLGELLPVRRFEYGASAGVCRDTRCHGTANLDLRYGASTRWTVQAGLDQFWRDSLPDLFHPYATVVGSVTNAWGFEGEAVAHGFVRGAVRYEPSLHVRVMAFAARFDSSRVEPILTGAGQVSQWGVTGFLRPIPAKSLFFFDGQLDRLETGALITTRARLGASLQSEAVRLLPFVRVERFRPRGGSATSTGFVGLGAFVLPRASAGRILGSVLLRANLEAAGLDSLTSASLFVSRPLWTGVRLEAGLTWQRAAPGPTLQIVLSSYLPSVRTYTTVTAPTGSQTTASQFVQGSVLWDATSRRLRLAPGPSLERAGLAGWVFLDANANGLWEPDEPALPNVRVRVGTATVETDSSGAFRVWDLVPFEPVMLVLDSLTLENPLWVPSYATVSVVPGPNRFRSVELPVVQGGEVEGRVTRVTDGRSEGVGGVTVELTEVATGARRTVVTFTDGDFYLMGLRPGNYRVTVNERALRALGATAEPTAFSLPPGASRVDRIEIRLRPAP